MKMKSRFPVILFSCLIVLLIPVACQGGADHDIRGTWAYTMTSADSNTYDIGTITFSGSLTRGSYREVNVYEVTYEGEYKVSGTTLTLTGYEAWQGTIIDPNRMSGTWQHADGSAGTWEAVRQNP